MIGARGARGGGGGERARVLVDMRGKEVAWCAPHHGLLEFDPTRQQHSASTPKKMTKKSPTPSPATRVDEAAAALCASAPAAMHMANVVGGSRVVALTLPR